MLADRRAEEVATKPATNVIQKEDNPEQLDAVWKQLNATPGNGASFSASTTPATNMVKIKRTYEFAGQIVT